jgi:hypothetical protein
MIETFEGLRYGDDRLAILESLRRAVPQMHTPKSESIARSA